MGLTRCDSHEWCRATPPATARTREVEDAHANSHPSRLRAPVRQDPPIATHTGENKNDDNESDLENDKQKNEHYDRKQTTSTQHARIKQDVPRALVLLNKSIFYLG